MYIYNVKLYVTLYYSIVDFLYRTTELPDLFNIKLLPLFLMKLLVILCIFQILKCFSMKLLTEIIHISWLIKFFLITIFFKYKCDDHSATWHFY